MTTARLLYDLQELDAELAQGRTRLTALAAKVGDEGPLAAPRARAEEARRRLARLRAQQQDQELAVDSLRQRVRGLEQRMYGGRVGNPRELESLQREVAQLRQQASRGEDRALELMEEMEAAQEEARRAEEALAEAEARWRQEQQEARQQLEGLRASLASLEARRQEAAARVPPPALALYDRLRAARGGVAVARVERGVCRGCRVGLPAAELQRARVSREPVFCPTCGRVLYVD